MRGYSSIMKNKTAKAIISALCIFLLLEIALQVRSHIRYGTSVLNALFGETTYKINEDISLKLLRENAKISGNQATIITNSLGLRSPEIDSKKPPNTLRIAVLGASSIMGTYTRENQDTISYRLQHYLQAVLPQKNIEVINGGIAGHGLRDQAKMLKHIILPLKPDLLIWYSGFNDISGYCHTSISENKTSWALPTLKPPSWLLTVELLTKNTVFLRTIKASKDSSITMKDIDTRRYQADINNLLDIATGNKLPVIAVMNARAFREDMPEHRQLALSETARFYNACFDLPALHQVYDYHNQLIKDSATKAQATVLPLNDIIPGGRRYFSDATHFSTEGSDFFAKYLSDTILKDMSKGGKKP